MRNLKKVLALVLALVMSLSLVTIANATDFSDDADIDYEEAVDVMSAIGVIDGVGNNQFDPDGTLTREQAAKLITYMLMGANADKLGVESTSFKDVAATRWSAPAIEYCATLGIIDGAGDGNFYPAGKLTGYAFAKMLLTALGYDSSIEGFVGNNWTINVASMGMEVGLHNGMENMFGSAELSRQEAAQMALNAIKAPLVQYANGNRWEYVTTTIARQQNISDRRLTNAGINAQNTGYTVEFGEKYFPNLRLNSETDDFERPSHTWVFENKELGTYVDYDLLVETYTEAVSHKTLYNLLGRSNLQDYDFEYYVDGVKWVGGTNKKLEADLILARTNDDAGFSDNGVLTQVFVDHDFDEGTGLIKITSIHTFLAKVTTSYNEKRGEVGMDIYYPNTTMQSFNKVAGEVDVDGISDLEEDDFVLVNISGKDKGAATPTSYGTNFDVVKVSDVEILSDRTLTEFSKDSDSDPDSDQPGHEALFKSVTTDGKKYDGSSRAAYDADEVLDLYANDRLVNKTYNIYLDQYGYVIGVDLYSGDDNYVFITGFDTNGSAISASNIDAAAIFVDGTMRTIKVNVKDTNKNIRNATDPTSNDGEDYFDETTTFNNDLDKQATVNRWFTYTEADGVYTLTPATRMLTTKADGMTKAASVLKCNSVVLDRTAADTNDSTPHPSAAGSVRVYGNDDSVFLVAEVDNTDAPAGMVITGVDSVYTGVQNVEINLYCANNDEVDATLNSTGLLIDTTDQTQLFDNTYTVYDKNNYIIASVVLGEVKGGNANYVYTLTAAKAERYDSASKNHYWTFDAVVDGKIETLTVESKFTNTINDLRPGHIQEVRYTGDYVTSIKMVMDKDTTTNWQNKIYADPTHGRIDPDYHEIYDVGHVSANGLGSSHYWDCADTKDNTVSGSTNGYATDYQQRLDVDNLKLEGRTLYLDKPNDYGLTLASDSVPTVLIQNEGGKTNVKTEYPSVKAAISAMQDSDESVDGFGFKGRITAVLDSQGRAKWVVIKSDTTVPTASGGSSNNNGRVANATYNSGTKVVHVVDAGNNSVASVTVILEQLRDSGWVYVDDFRTDSNGDTEALPTLSGNTYRVTIGSYRKIFTT